MTKRLKIGLLRDVLLGMTASYLSLQQPLAFGEDNVENLLILNPKFLSSGTSSQASILKRRSSILIFLKHQASNKARSKLMRLSQTQKRVR